MGKCPVPGGGTPFRVSRGLALALSLGGFLIFLPLAACTVPDVEDEIAAPADAEAPVILGAAGPLSAEESDAVLARLAETSADATTLQRFAAIEEAVAETPLVAGNTTRVLRDGPESFDAMFAAIRGAADHVDMEYYILEDVEHEGVRLGDLLVEKLRDGVAVNIIYDAFGSLDTPAAFFDRLREAGAGIVAYNPIDPLAGEAAYAPNQRTHRKILIADGRTAIIGGVNLAEDYQSLGSALSSPPEAPPGGEGYRWRDTNLQIDGPAVAQLQALFLAHWEEQGGAALDQVALFPEIPADGPEVVRIVGSAGDDGVSRYYVTLLTAIRNAEDRVWLTIGYFAPPPQAIEDLAAAAQAGTDVRLLLPGVSDFEAAIDAARAHYTELLEAGVRIWEMDDAILHAKTATVDGVWSVVGSSNIDYRSVLFNDEVDAVILGSDTAAQLEAMFEADAAAAREIDLETWRNRPLGQRLEEFFWRLWDGLL
jgi:cardiolipin synthase